MVIPQEDFIHGKLGVRASSDESKNIASKEHLHDTNASIEL
jgi:hypothetical protein